MVSIDDGVLAAKATAGDTPLGGQDLDNVLMDHFVKEFKRTNKSELTKSMGAMRRLRTQCKRTKRPLSAAIRATIVDSLTSINHDAAVQTAVLSGDEIGEPADILLIDGTPLSFGIETAGGIFKKLIEKKYETTPCKTHDTFTKYTMHLYAIKCYVNLWYTSRCW